MNPSTLPSDIDEILEKHSLDALRAAGIVYKQKLHQANLLLIDKAAKQAIQNLLASQVAAARIDEAEWWYEGFGDGTKAAQERLRSLR